MLYFITGISRNCLQEETGGRVRFQAGKLGHTPTHANIHNVYIQGEEYWGRCQGQV